MTFTRMITALDSQSGIPMRAISGGAGMTISQLSGPSDDPKAG